MYFKKYRKQCLFYFSKGHTSFGKHWSCCKSCTDLFWLAVGKEISAEAKGWSSMEDLEAEYSNSAMYLKDFMNRELCSMKELNKVLSDSLQMLCRHTEYTTVWTCNCTKSLFFFSIWSSRNASGTWKNLVLLCLPVWGCFMYNLEK